MQAEKPRAQTGKGNIEELWRRAPAFRGIVYVAASVSLIGVIALSFDYGIPVNVVSSSPEAAKSALIPSQTPAARPEAAPLPQQPAQSRESEPLAMAVQKPAVSAQVAPLAGEEDAQRARCHPHLIPISATMPQIDVSRMVDPSLGHIKVHFWVDGAGLVTREVLTATTYATEAERQAELDFTKGLTFTVPNTAECRVREMELIGDYFEMRNASGQWGTYVRLYPRLSFDTDGIVRSRE